MKIIAFYLPQYHKSIENDEWWGNNFTEWTKVKQAKAYFEFHEQPKIPLNSNYYDITEGNVIKWQIDLAKENNIYGFCLYHYWSNGKRLLSNGIDSFLQNNDDFPFSFCWANHNWTRQWQGKGNEILFYQEYSKLDIQAHVNWLFTHVFYKTNYMRINGKLLLTIFSIYNLPNAKGYIAQLREEAKKYNEELYIISMLKTNKHSPFSTSVGADSFIVRQPYVKHSLVESINIIPYSEIMNNYIFGYKSSDSSEIPNIFNAYDNTPRRERNNSLIVKDTSPILFKKYLHELLSHRKNQSHVNGLLYLTAWNEWGEGNYFEPCKNYYDGYLKVIKETTLLQKIKKNNEKYY